MGCSNLGYAIIILYVEHKNRINVQLLETKKKLSKYFKFVSITFFDYLTIYLIFSKIFKLIFQTQNNRIYCTLQNNFPPFLDVLSTYSNQTFKAVLIKP